MLCIKLPVTNGLNCIMQHKFLITNFSFVFSETEKVKNQNGFHRVGVGMEMVFSCPTKIGAGVGGETFLLMLPKYQVLVFMRKGR